MSHASQSSAGSKCKTTVVLSRINMSSSPRTAPHHELAALRLKDQWICCKKKKSFFTSLSSVQFYNQWVHTRISQVWGSIKFRYFWSVIWYERSTQPCSTSYKPRIWQFFYLNFFFCLSTVDGKLGKLINTSKSKKKDFSYAMDILP